MTFQDSLRKDCCASTTAWSARRAVIWNSSLRSPLNLNPLSNYRTTADAGIPLLLHAVSPWPRTAECGRSGDEVRMSLTLTIRQDRYQLGSAVVERPPSLGLIEGVLGKGRLWKPDEELVRRRSTIHTFDEAGVWIYEDNGVVGQVSILLSEPVPRIGFHPAKVFNGAVVIKGSVIEDADDFFSVEHDSLDVNEWETEGSASIDLARVRCNLWGNSKTGRIEDLSFWFP